MTDLALDIYLNYHRLDAMRAEDLGDALGLTGASLMRMGVGSHEAGWVFPMVDGSLFRVNFEVLAEDAVESVACPVSGGLLVPTMAGGGRILMLTQGAVNVAALLDMGFDAMGLAYCGSCVKDARSVVIELTRRCGWSEVVLLEERTKPGTSVSKRTRSMYADLEKALRGGRRKVSAIRPPVGINNAYGWLRSGGDADDVMAVIDGEEPATVGRYQWMKQEPAA